MCAPIGDGAAAALLVSERFLPAPAQRYCRASGAGCWPPAYRAVNTGALTSPDCPERRLCRRINKRVSRLPILMLPKCTTATSFCEIYQAEMLGFCEPGQGGPFIASGATHLGGSLPINTSGGLVSKGHPVGATGLSMLAELAEQLRGEAGQRQVPQAHTALAENGGGAMGFDEAACSVVILQRC